MLKKNQINFFHTNGYLIIKNFYSSKEFYQIKKEIISLIEEIANEFNVKLFQTNNQDIFLKKNINILTRKNRRYVSLIYDATKQLPGLINILNNKKNFRVFKQLREKSLPGIVGNGFGIRVDLPKEKKYEAQCHQELPFQMRSKDGIVFWSPLIKFLKNSGYLKIYKKSHNFGCFPLYVKKQKMKSTSYSFNIKNEKTLKKNFKCIQAKMNTKDLLLLDFLTLHQSGRNTSSYPRLTVQYRLFNYKSKFGKKIGWSGSFSSGIKLKEIKEKLSYLDNQYI